MNRCSKCGVWVGSRGDHENCEEAAARAAAAAAKSAEDEKALQRLQPVIQRAVYRGVMLAGLTWLGVGLVIGFFYGAMTIH